MSVRQYASGHLPRLELPRLPISRATPITQHRRLELLGQLLTEPEVGTPWSRYASGDHNRGHQPE